MPNPFLYKLSVLFQIIHSLIVKNISISSYSVDQTVLFQPIQLSISINVKTILFQAIQLSISTQFKCQNNSILNNSV